MAPRIPNVLAPAVSYFGLALYVIDGKINAKKYKKQDDENRRFEEHMKNTYGK